MEKIVSQNIKWINCVKIISIIAVIMNHIYAPSTMGTTLCRLAIFCVSVFVFLSGITSSLSNQKHYSNGESIWRHALHRSFSFMISSLFAVIVYYIFLNGFFYLPDFLQFMIRFPGVFYFVPFYFQLILISPVIFLLIRRIQQYRYKNWLLTLFMIIILILSVLCTERTFLFDAYAGAKFLFGGSYFFIFVSGMVFGMTPYHSLPSKKLFLASLISIISSFLWAQRFLFNYSDDAPFYSGWGLNPPGFYVMVYSAFVFIFLYSFFNLLEKEGKCKRLIDKCDVLGKKTLLIFLYQIPIIDILQRSQFVMNLSGYIRYPLILICAFTIPLLFDWGYQKTKHWLLTG